MGLREASTTQAVIDAPPSRLAVGDWRTRLRTALYALHRHLLEPGERVKWMLDADVEDLVELIDAGRAEPTAPPTLTRFTAESLGGAILQQVALAAARERPAPEAELVPDLMYSAVLPYMGPAAAAEELRIPPPPR
jgi:hypothetical protein